MRPAFEQDVREKKGDSSCEDCEGRDKKSEQVFDLFGA